MATPTTRYSSLLRKLARALARGAARQVETHTFLDVARTASTRANLHREILALFREVFRRPT
jgi:hypothetical protein